MYVRHGIDGVGDWEVAQGIGDAVAAGPGGVDAFRGLSDGRVSASETESVLTAV